MPGAARFRLTVRDGPKVRHERFGDLDLALEALAERVDGLSRLRRTPVDLHVRRFDPVQQVAARIELAGDGVRAGVDLRGDGSAEAWRGRWRRRLVEQEPGEDAVDALRRVLRS
jgi:FAD/FMN-containing dehydrogenase